MRFSPQDSQVIEKCIEEVELVSQAEVVLAVTDASGNYRDLDALFGAAVAFLVLGFKLFSPWEFHPASLPLPIGLSFFMGAWVSKRLGLRRYFSSQKRQIRQVRRTAQAFFLEKAMNHTHLQTGILIYLSRQEKKAEIICDWGVEKAVAKERWATFHDDLQQVFDSQTPSETLGQFIRTLGVYLSQVLPAVELHDELPNAVQFDFESEI